MPATLSQSEGSAACAPLDLTPTAQLQAEAGARTSLAGPASERIWGPLSGPHRFAVHEAAHCMAAYFSNSPASHVSIIPPDVATGGYMLTKAVSYESAIHVRGTSLISSDQRAALLSLYMANTKAGWKKLLGRMRIARRRADEFVRDYAPIISALADRLLVDKELDANQIRETIEAAIRERNLARLRELQAGRAQAPVIGM